MSAHAGAIVEAPSDVQAVEQIVGELIGNVQRYAPGPFCAELHRNDGALHLAVHDPGPCFHPDRIHQTDASDWEAEHGRGLAIIEALGGTVRTHHAEDAGCRVSVRLPMRMNDEPVPVPPFCPHDHPAARGEHCPRIRHFIETATGSGVRPN